MALAVRLAIEWLYKALLLGTIRKNLTFICGGNSVRSGTFDKENEGTKHCLAETVCMMELFFFVMCHCHDLV